MLGMLQTTLCSTNKLKHRWIFKELQIYRLIHRIDSKGFTAPMLVNLQKLLILMRKPSQIVFLCTGTIAAAALMKHKQESCR